MTFGRSHEKGFVRVCLLLAAAFACRAQQQPVAFPHNTHLKMGLECLDCHSGADVHSSAGIPSVAKCMLCHAKLGRDKPEVKKVVAYADKGIEIPWVRIYEFSSSAHVKFKHAPHYRAGIACAACHGDMTQATVAQKLVTHDMGTCLTCHRQKRASEDCATCHY